MKWFQVWVSFPKTFLCLQNLLVCYSVQNNEITVIRLSVSIIHALCLFFLKLMKYPPAPLNSHLSTATKACRPNTARVQSLGNVSILAAAKKIHSYVCLIRRKGFLSVLVQMSRKACWSNDCRFVLKSGVNRSVCAYTCIAGRRGHHEPCWMLIQN